MLDDTLEGKTHQQFMNFAIVFGCFTCSRNRTLHKQPRIRHANVAELESLRKFDLAKYANG